jgi:hypothetical protein
MKNVEKISDECCIFDILKLTHNRFFEESISKRIMIKPEYKILKDDVQQLVQEKCNGDSIYLVHALVQSVRKYNK